MVCALSKRLDLARELHVKKVQRETRYNTFGAGPEPYPDVEADEVDLGLSDFNTECKDPKEKVLQ